MRDGRLKYTVQKEEGVIDKWDIARLEKWLKLAKTKGTDAIKIVCGDKPDTWIVTEENNQEENNVSNFRRSKRPR